MAQSTTGRISSVPSGGATTVRTVFSVASALRASLFPPVTEVIGPASRRARSAAPYRPRRRGPRCPPIPHHRRSGPRRRAPLPHTGSDPTRGTGEPDITGTAGSTRPSSPTDPSGSCGNSGVAAGLHPPDRQRATRDLASPIHARSRRPADSRKRQVTGFTHDPRTGLDATASGNPGQMKKSPCPPR